MTRMLVSTDTAETSDRLGEYLEKALEDDDEVVICNSLAGGDGTTEADVAAGDTALDDLADVLGEHVVERRQYVRGNDPVEDITAAADAFDVDEHVIGIRKHTPVGKVVFGSTAQSLLLEASRPVRCVPLVS